MSQPSTKGELLRVLFAEANDRYRRGDVGLPDDLQIFLSYTDQERAGFIRDSVRDKRNLLPPEEKFEVRKDGDLGVIEVPPHYGHGQLVDELKHKYQGNSVITGLEPLNPAWFSRSSCVLRVGERYHVEVVTQKEEGLTTWTERLKYLKERGAVHPGAHGLLLVFDQKRHMLPVQRERWFTVIDVEEHLYMSNRQLYVLVMEKEEAGTYKLCVSPVNRAISENTAFLCFTKEAS
jgi:hypothetical protein